VALSIPSGSTVLFGLAPPGMSRGWIVAVLRPPEPAGRAPADLPHRSSVWCIIPPRGWTEAQDLRYSDLPSRQVLRISLWGAYMDKPRFQELQFLTLRKEIEDSLNRSFQIMVGGATLVPILVGLLGHYAATPILLTLPMTVVVVALLYLNQWNSIMRCGRYIRTRIEPKMTGDEGWEAWLESHPDTHMGAVHNRLVDTYLVYAFYLLTAAYYFATSFIAITYAHRTYGSIAEWVALGCYILIGITMGYIILERVPTHTTTKTERQLMAPQAAMASNSRENSANGGGTATAPNVVSSTAPVSRTDPPRSRRSKKAPPSRSGA
jgi:hypothetical protein